MRIYTAYMDIPMLGEDRLVHKLERDVQWVGEIMSWLRRASFFLLAKR
jgi:hypothetical protein